MNIHITDAGLQLTAMISEREKCIIETALHLYSLKQPSCLEEQKEIIEAKKMHDQLNCIIIPVL